MNIGIADRLNIGLIIAEQAIDVLQQLLTDDILNDPKDADLFS